MPETSVHLEPWQRDFVEHVAARSDLGLSRSLLRTLAWLVVCEPPYQSADQIQERLRLSAGSVSAATSALVRAGVIARKTLHGDRRTYYALDPQGWRRLLAGRLEMLGRLRSVTDDALTDGDPNDRLRSMRDLLAACEAQLEPVLADARPVGGAGGKRARGKKKAR